MVLKSVIRILFRFTHRASFEDGEVFQTAKSFVYFIVKGEVEIWKVGPVNLRGLMSGSCSFCS